MNTSNDERTAIIVAHILGPSCAANRALLELDRMRASGTPATIRLVNDAWIVSADQQAQPDQSRKTDTQ